MKQATWDKIKAQNKIDSSLIRQLSDISYSSTRGVREQKRSLSEGIVNLGTIPFDVDLPRTEITKEMIMEYHKSQAGPLIDPITGVVKADKYNPSTFAYDVTQAQSMPSLVDDPTLGHPANQVDIQNYRDDIHQLLKVDLPKANADYYNLMVDLEVLKDILDNGNFVTVGTTTSRRALTAGQVTNLEGEIATKEGEIKLQDNHIHQIQDDADDLYSAMKSAKQNIEDNKTIVIQHNKDIRDNVRLFKENLIANNASKIYLEQQPNESDADFLQRMKDVESEKFDINLYQEKGHLEQIIRLKLNLKDIIRSDELIENVTKSFTADQIFVINKHYIQIKDKFLETYGFDNKNLTTSDIIDVITNSLERILNPPLEYEIQNDTSIIPVSGETVPIDTFSYVDTSGTPVATDFRFGTDTNSLYIKNTANNNHVFLKVGEKARKLIFYSKNLSSQGSFIAVKQKGEPREDLLNHILFTYLKLDDITNHEIFKGSKHFNDIYDTLINDYKLIPLTNIKSTKPTPTTVRYGWGISHPEETIPNHGKFGKLVILLNKLFYKNMLSLKYQSGHSIQGFPTIKVSDKFVEIIMGIYNDSNVANLVKNLNTDEKNLLDSILFMAGLNKKIVTDTGKSLAGLKEQFKIIEGEIFAGNNNPEVLKELKDVLLKLNHLGAISLSGIKTYLKQFE